MIAAGTEMAISQLDGSFVLDRVRVGDLELATTPYRRVSGVIHVVEGDRNRADIVVEPLGVLRGTIRRHGAPVPFARVDIVGPSRAGLTADAFGHYEATGLEPGRYGYYCDDRRLGAVFAEERMVTLGPGETREQDIELVWGGTIAGHVVDAHGDPVAGVEVRFIGEMAPRCVTDAAGGFACSGLPGGTYTAMVFPGSGAAHAFRFVEPPTTSELRDGDARIDGVRLVIETKLFTIEGAVVDGSGAPVADIAVHARGVDRRALSNFRTIPGSIADADGHFRITELSAGDYHVEVESAERAARQTVVAGATNVRLVLDRSPCDGARGHELPAAFVRSPPHVVWDQKLELVGWSLPATATVDAPFGITLIYRALQPVDRDWKVFVHFDSPAHRLNADHEPGIGWCPTSRWAAGETIVDRATAQFDHPGRYALTIGFFRGGAPDWINLPVSAPAAMDQRQNGVHIADVLVE
jgi:hypothetical protein